MEALPTLPLTPPSEAEASPASVGTDVRGSGAATDGGGAEGLLFALALAQVLPTQTTLPGTPGSATEGAEESAATPTAVDRDHPEFRQFLSRVAVHSQPPAGTPVSDTAEPIQTPAPNTERAQRSEVPNGPPAPSPAPVETTAVTSNPTQRTAPGETTAVSSNPTQRTAPGETTAVSSNPTERTAPGETTAVTSNPTQRTAPGETSATPGFQDAPVLKPTPFTQTGAERTLPIPAIPAAPAPTASERLLATATRDAEAPNPLLGLQAVVPDSSPVPPQSRPSQRVPAKGVAAQRSESPTAALERIQAEPHSNDTEANPTRSLESRAESSADYNRTPLETIVKPTPSPVAPLTPIAAQIPEVARPSSEPTLAPGTARLSSQGTSELQAQIETLSNSGGGTARLRLNPPHLGEVQIQVRMRGERVDVQIQTEEIAARSALLDAGSSLVDALASKSLRVEQFDVILRDSAHPQGGDREAGTDPRQGSERRDQAEPTATADGRSKPELIDEPAPWQKPGRSELTGGIDLRV